MKAVDDERVLVALNLGLKILQDTDLGVLQGYMQENNYETGCRNSSGFKGIKAQNQLDHRYFNKDVGFGLVFISALAKKVKIATPVIDTIIMITSIVMIKDYRKEKENILDTLGLTAYLNSGIDQH